MIFYRVMVCMSFVLSDSPPNPNRNPKKNIITVSSDAPQGLPDLPFFERLRGLLEPGERRERHECCRNASYSVRLSSVQETSWNYELVVL